MTKKSKLPKAWFPYGWSERREKIGKLPKRVGVLLSAEWAASVLPIWVAERSPDYRPANAIHAAWNWVEGSADDDAAADSASAVKFAGSISAAVAADSAACAAANAADSDKWQWIYRTYLRCKGPKLSFDPAWRTTEAVALARGMWERRRADCLPILADALQEAGFDHSKTLKDMRSNHDEHLLSEWAIWNLLGFGSDFPANSN